MAWTVVGILGIGMAAGGVWFLTDDGGGANIVDAGDDDASLVAAASATSTRTSTPSPTATPSPSPTPTETPTPTATTRPNVATNPATGGGAVTGNQPAAPTPTPEPTEPPVVAGGEYCPNNTSSAPPNTVFGLFTIGGAPAPKGTSVSLAFDGVVGPTRATTADGGYRVDYAAGPTTCANRVGAAISVVYNGGFYPTGHVVGDSPGVPVTKTLTVP